MHRFGFILFILFNIGVVGAQSLHFKNISIEEGLASTECYEVLQDHLGYIWVSTDAGLCKYNGRNFTTFTIANGLPSNTMFEIMEDRYGRLWGACFNGGIFYIYKDSVYSIEANEELKQKNSSSKEIITKLVLDEKNILHVGTTADYYTITPQNNYASVTSMAANITDSSTYFLTFVNHQTLYGRFLYLQRHTTSYNQTVWLNNKKQTFRPSIFRLNSTWDYYALREDEDSYFFSFSGTLFYFNEGVYQSKEFDHNIVTLYQDSKKNLWIGFRQKGFLMYPQSDLSNQPIRGLGTETASSFFEDHEGGIWISTTTNGVYYCPNSNIRYYDPLINKRVVGLGMIDDKVMVSTSTHVLHQLDSSGAHSMLDLSIYPETEKVDLQSFNGIHYKTGGASFLFDGRWKHRPIRNSLGEMLYEISQVIEMEGSVWGINSLYLLCIENALMKERYKLPSRGFCLWYTTRKEFLVGCLNGLYIFEKGVFTKMSLGTGANECRISCLVEDAGGNLIAGTKGHGIFIRKGQEWLNLNEKMGLASNSCNDVFCTPHYYYVSTNKGYSVIDRTNGMGITNIDLSNGIPSNEVNKVAQYGRRVYIITEKGACTFPSHINIYNSHATELVVERIFIGTVGLVDKQVYPFYQNDLFFNCDVMSFQNPSKNKIKYQLFPLDTIPNYSSSFGVNYDNLPPGDYTLCIQGVNNNGLEGVTSVYHFSIQPPFWVTWWFISIVMLVFILLAYFLVRKRILFIKKRESEKNVLKEKILEFHYMALRAQMNPHFIFNVINSIQLYVLQNQPTEAYRYLSKFSKLIRRVLQNSKERLVTLDDEIETIRLYLDLEKIRLDDEMKFGIIIDASIEASRVFVPSMIIQPLLENAIWHGIVPLNGIRPGKIYLHISYREGMLMISIKDNGVGMRVDDKKAKKSSMGLDLIKDRLALLSNRSSFTVAHLMGENNEIQGTEVIISFPIIIKS
jgi:ligand-binding sensor domain-containing protein